MTVLNFQDKYLTISLSMLNHDFLYKAKAVGLCYTKILLKATSLFSFNYLEILETLYVFLFTPRIKQIPFCLKAVIFDELYYYPCKWNKNRPSLG